MIQKKRPMMTRIASGGGGVTITSNGSTSTSDRFLTRIIAAATDWILIVRYSTAIGSGGILLYCLCVCVCVNKATIDTDAEESLCRIHRNECHLFDAPQCIAIQSRLWIWPIRSACARMCVYVSVNVQHWGRQLVLRGTLDVIAVGIAPFSILKIIISVYIIFHIKSPYLLKNNKQ